MLCFPELQSLSLKESPLISVEQETPQSQARNPLHDLVTNKGHCFRQHIRIEQLGISSIHRHHRSVHLYFSRSRSSYHETPAAPPVFHQASEPDSPSSVSGPRQQSLFCLSLLPATPVLSRRYRRAPSVAPGRAADAVGRPPARSP